MLRILVVASVLVISPAFAGTFSTPHAVPTGEHAVGVEPEIYLTSGAGVGSNLRYTYGLSDLNNLNFILGTGTGPRRFRFGGNMTFDFFPDVEGQPGIGVALQGLYYRLADRGQLEVQVIPYLHKAFLTGKSDSEIEPYFSVPFGLGFSDGSYRSVTSLVIGSMFKGSEKVRTILELGIAVNNTETYLSAGVVYYP
jgi:hypothetical protein